jgi:hypothetical protein
MKKKTEFKCGTAARQSFERTMAALFRVPKATAKKPEKPVDKKVERQQS